MLLVGTLLLLALVRSCSRKLSMTITGIHGTSIATQWLQIVSYYAYISDDSDSSRGISQIAPEEIEISSEERKNSSDESNETSEESNDKSEEFHHFLGRKSKTSPEIFENSSGEIEMSSLSPYYYNESAVQVEVAGIVISRLFRTFTEPKMRKCDLIASFALGINNITC